jgi:hypothetical protein
MKERKLAMKRDLKITYHSMRMMWHWNRMRRIGEASALIHEALMLFNPTYKQSSIKFNESKRMLIEMGEYQPAVSISRNTVTA